MDLDSCTKEELIAYIKVIEYDPERIVREKLEEYSEERYQTGYRYGYDIGYGKASIERIGKLVQSSAKEFSNYIKDNIQRALYDAYGEKSINMQHVPPRIPSDIISTGSFKDHMTMTTKIHIRMKPFTLEISVDDMV